MYGCSSDYGSQIRSPLLRQQFVVSVMMVSMSELSSRRIYFDIDVHGYMNDDVVSRCNVDAGNNSQRDVLVSNAI